MARIVMTFGAAALQGSDSLLTIGEALRQSHQAGNAVLAVVDALPGVTGLIQQSVEHGGHDRVYHKLLSMHSSMARKLVREERDRAMLLQDIEDMLGSYRWLGRSMVNRGPTPAEAATMLAIGERLSTRLLAAYLQSRGIPASAINSHECLVADDNYLSATPDLERSRQRCGQQIAPLVATGHTVIVGGNGGGTDDHRPTRLAGDGLSLTGSLLAAFHGASGLWLMGSHDGILTGDSGLVTDARTMPILPVAALRDMADYGCDVPSAIALQAAIDAHIPVFVRSIFQPTYPGTFIQPQIGHETGSAGPVVVQQKIGMLHASGIEPQAGLQALHSDQVPAAMSVDSAVFFVDQARLNSAHLALSQSFPGANLRAHRESNALITVLGIDDSARDDLFAYMKAAVRRAGSPAQEIFPTVGRSGKANFSTLVPPESIEAAVNEIHNLVVNPAK